MRIEEEKHFKRKEKDAISLNWQVLRQQWDLREIGPASCSVGLVVFKHVANPLTFFTWDWPGPCTCLKEKNVIEVVLGDF